MMDVESNQDIWQVEANGGIFETNFAEMTAWINEGSLLRIDRVRKGNLRWIEAGKVPTRESFVDALDKLGTIDLRGFRAKFSATNHNGSSLVELTVIGTGGNYKR